MTGQRDDDPEEQELTEHIRRFPHLYPRSLGGTGPERRGSRTDLGDESDPHLRNPMPDEVDFGDDPEAEVDRILDDSDLIFDDG